MWWLPDATEKKIGGILTVEPSGTCELQLTGSLLVNPLWGNGLDADGPLDGANPVVHGEASGEEFTILFPRVAGGGAGTPFEDQSQHLTPHVVIRGIHLASHDEKVFTGAEIELDNLTAWSSLTGFTSNMNLKAMRGESADYWVRYQLARPLAPNEKGFLKGFDVELKWVSMFNPQVTETHAGRQLKASELVKAKFENQEPCAWDWFLGVTKSFQDLLTFATRHPCAIRSCQLLVSAASGVSGRIELIREAFVAPRPDAEAQWNKFLFRTKDVSFSDLLGTWDKLSSDVGMGVHVLFGLDYERGGYLENRIMNAASAAESIHRALHPKATGLPAEEFKATITKIKAAITGSENGPWFVGRLRNDPGFTDRMHQLAEIPSKKAVTALLEDTNQWAKWLKDARNSVAHLEGEDLAKIPENARYEIPAVTIALLHLVFLAELGLSPDIQLRAVNVVYAGTT
jgi:hypothetical protein